MLSVERTGNPSSSIRREPCKHSSLYAEADAHSQIVMQQSSQALSPEKRRKFSGRATNKIIMHDWTNKEASKQVVSMYMQQLHTRSVELTLSLSVAAKRSSRLTDKATVSNWNPRL